MWLLSAQPPPDNGDGLQFRSADGTASITVGGGWVSNFGLDWQIYRNATIERARTSGTQITYQTNGPNWFVYSGYVNDQIVYFKAVAGCRDGSVADQLTVQYDAAQRSKYDQIVSVVSKSMKAQVGLECKD